MILEGVAGSCSKHLAACQEFQISTPWINSQAYFTPEEVVFCLTITCKTIFILIFVDLLKFSLSINIKTFEKGKKNWRMKLTGTALSLLCPLW